MAKRQKTCDSIESNDAIVVDREKEKIMISVLSKGEQISSILSIDQARSLARKIQSRVSQIMLLKGSKKVDY